MGANSLSPLLLHSCLILIIDIKQYPSGYGQHLECEEGYEIP